jgi:hypothetical protein
MSTPTAYPPFAYDLFASSSKSSQHDFNTTDEKAARREHFLTASEQGRRDEIDTILALPPQYRNANWNGEGAVPIPEAAIHEARAFLQKLPPAFPLPEVTPEPDGYLGLEWYANPSLLYVVSFNGTGVLSCSGFIGPERTYGTRYMDEGIPAEILRYIAKVIR